LTSAVRAANRSLRVFGFFGIVLDVHLARSFDGVIRGAVQPELEEVIGLLGEPEAGVLDGTFGSVAFR
jgi:hypothetical protein